jgi:hypothetical protein
MRCFRSPMAVDTSGPSHRPSTQFARDPVRPRCGRACPKVPEATRPPNEHYLHYLRRGERRLLYGAGPWNGVVSMQSQTRRGKKDQETPPQTSTEGTSGSHCTNPHRPITAPRQGGRPAQVPRPPLVGSWGGTRGSRERATWGSRPLEAVLEWKLRIDGMVCILGGEEEEQSESIITFVVPRRPRD